jgi:pimeloyl-ACP methyl ester carboxylesterase
MRREPVAFHCAGVELRGTLSVPEGAGPMPAIVTVHGATGWSRDFRLFTHLQELVEPLPMATLRYDRRGSGESGGDFASADFRLLADDALAAVELLRRDPRIDAGRIGLFGFSQGGWIAPEAASRSAEIAFLVLVGACAVTPAEQMSFTAATALRRAGYSAAVVEEMLELRAVVDAVVRGGGDRDAVAARVAAASAEPWFELAYLSAPGEADDDPKWRLEMDYRIEPALATLNARTLLINGDHDRWVPVTETQRIWREGFGARHPDRLTTVRLPGFGHYPTLANGEDGEDGAPISPEYEAVVLDWLARETATETLRKGERLG